MASSRWLISLVLLAGCATPVVDITVSEPKVFGDEQVLKQLAEQQRRVRPLAGGVQESEFQESFGVSQDSRTRSTLSANLIDPVSPAAEPPGSLQRPRSRFYALSGYYPPAPGLSFGEAFRKRLDADQLVSATELLYAGDAKLLARQTRVALLRFDLSINNYLDLGGRREFAVVEFRVRPKGDPAAKFSVYLLVCLTLSTAVYVGLGARSEVLVAGLIPFVLWGSMALNFHHYVVDGVIWKSRRRAGASS